MKTYNLIKSALICVICGLTFNLAHAEEEKQTVTTTRGEVEVSFRPGTGEMAVLKDTKSSHYYYYVKRDKEAQAVVAIYADETGEKQLSGYRREPVDLRALLKDPQELVKIFDAADAQSAQAKQDQPPKVEFEKSETLPGGLFIKYHIKGGKGYIEQSHRRLNPNNPNSGVNDPESGWAQYEYIKDKKGNTKELLTKSTSGMSDHGYGINLHDETGYKYRHYYINRNKDEKLDVNKIFTPSKDKIKSGYDNKARKEVGTEYYDVDFLKTSALEKKALYEAVAEYIATPKVEKQISLNGVSRNFSSFPPA